MLRSIGEAPVIYDSLSTRRSMEDLQMQLVNMGYLRASMDAMTKAKNKKIDVTYLLHPGKPYFIRNVDYVIQDSMIAQLLQLDKPENRQLKTGMQFSVQNLDGERKRITRELNNLGYYRFNKEYITFEADSVGTQEIDVVLVLRKQRDNDGHESAHQRYKVDEVVFCNKDIACCGKLSGVTWMDMFIREIKVWDSNFVQYHTINDYDKYSFIIPGGLLQMYNLTSGSLDQNTILDLRHPNEPNFAAIFPYEDDVINPDGDINYNIGWNFNWNDINYPFYIVSTKLMTENNRVKIFETNKCYEGCLKCFGFNKFSCYSCQPGYALKGFDPNSELELDFRSLNLDNYATITLFFYIKIYGFTQDQIDLYENNITDLFKVITLSEKENEEFILYYNITSDSIILKLGEKIQYKYTGILSKFGNWIPISISAFRANDYNFRKDFTSMTFDNLLLPYLGFDDDNEKIFSKFPFDTFKISKYLIAHIADVTLYDLFIINAFGYAQHKYLIDGNFSSTSGISRNNP